METLIKSDVFFFISTISVTVLTILLIVIFIYVIVILYKVKNAVKRLETQLETVKDDIVAFREKIIKSSIISSIFKLFIGRKRKK